MLCHFVALILSSRASWRRFKAPPCLLLGLRAFTVPAQPDVRQSQCGTVVSCVGGHRGRCEQFLFAAGCSTKELSKTTVSFWLQMPLSRVCRLSVTEQSVLCPLSSMHSCCRSVSSLRSILLSSWWEGEDVALALILAGLQGCYLGAVAPRFLAAFHRFCVVVVQALVLSRACSPRHITAY